MAIEWRQLDAGSSGWRRNATRKLAAMDHLPDGGRPRGPGDQPRLTFYVINVVDSP
jgi:hypothetical protein